MRAMDLGERSLIRRYVQPALSPPWVGTFTDDCAVLPIGEETALLVTTDAGPRTPFLLGLNVGTFEDVGHYLATMSLSDIAAMGGVPLAVVAACMMPREENVQHFEDALRGISISCEQHGARFVGGDTKEGPELRIVTSAIGRASSERVLWRSGAESEDLVCVSGHLGGALASYVSAYHLKEEGKPANVLRPRARIEMGRRLARDGLATACMDMSDGPVASARELAEASDKMIVLDVSSLPIVDAPEGKGVGRAWTRLVCSVGGDCELMFTCRPERRRAVEELGGLVCGHVESCAGRPDVRIVGPSECADFEPWEHFRSTEWIEKALEELL